MASNLGVWLASMSADQLAQILTRRPDVLAHPVPRTLAELADRLESLPSVRAAVHRLPLPAVQLIEAIHAHGGGPVARERLAALVGRRADDPDLDATLRVLAMRGLVWADGDDLRMATHAARAVARPPRPDPPLTAGGPETDQGPHARFTPRPPVPPLAEADPQAVAREAAAAANEAVARVTALLETCATAPPALLRAGGVGARELRRLGKAIGAPEAQTRLCLELAHTAGLLAMAGDDWPPTELLPTAMYDAWREGEPAQRLVPLLEAWWRLPAAPLAARSPTGEPAPAALSPPPLGDLIREVRRDLLDVLADLPADRGVVDGADLPPVLTWRAPLLVAAFADPTDVICATWREAGWLGLVAHGALTPLGRALLAGRAATDAEAPADPGDRPGTGDRPGAGTEPLAEAASRLLPRAVSTALLGADLTAVVPGTPTAALAALLDSAADRESVGEAVTWRFSPASVRRALDAGQTPDGLIAALAQVAAGGTVPQPLEYLIGDVARRHGEVRVRAVGCVIRGEDPALLAEIAAARALAPLDLTVLAPTVLASRKPVTETLAALRGAGYAPVGESPDGAPLIERVQRRRATARRRPLPVPSPRRQWTAPQPADPAALAAALLAGPRPTPARTSPAEAASTGGPARAITGRGGTRHDPEDTESLLAALAPHLSAGERHLLSHAIDHGTPVLIRYTNAQGNQSERVIEPIEVYGRVVEAWCRLREEERMFALDRIESVAPA